MRKLNKDDQANLRMTVDAEKKTVLMVHTVKPDTNSQTRFELTWTLNFKKATMEQLLLWSAKTVKIVLQDLWRKSPDRKQEDKWDNVPFEVVEVMESKRKPTDPLAKLAASIGKMSAEEKAAAIKLLQA